MKYENKFSSYWNCRHRSEENGFKILSTLEMDPKSIKINRQSYISGRGEDEEIDYAFIPLGNNCYIELVTPLTDGPTRRYLEKKGEGLFHLALESTNIKYTIDRFERAGIPQAGMTPTEGIFSVFSIPNLPMVSYCKL